MSRYHDRQLAIIRAGRYYELPNGGLCIYCGERSECKDHFFPVVMTLYKKDIPQNLKVLVEACHECNGMASDEYFFTFEKKQDYIRIRIQNKYLRILSMPDWTQGELHELSTDLRSYVECALERKKRLNGRLSYVPSAISISKINDTIDDSVVKNVNSDFTIRKPLLRENFSKTTWRIIQQFEKEERNKRINKYGE